MSVRVRSATAADADAVTAVHLASRATALPWLRLDAPTVDGELVRAQAGEFYGGWITDEVVGPFEGGVRHPRLVTPTP